MSKNPFNTDGLVQFTIMVLLFSVMQKNIWQFVVIALAGIFLHERIIFFIHCGGPFTMENGEPSLLQRQV